MKNSIKIAGSIFLFLCIAGCAKKDQLTGLPAINSENNKTVGASANDLLSDAKFNSIKIEVQYMPGFQPDATTLNNLTAFINTLVNKPGGIIITQKQIDSSGKNVCCF